VTTGEDLLAWFREVTEEIDGTPARLKILARRRRELARDLIALHGFEEAERLTGTSQWTLASLMSDGPAVPGAE
jgi:hypothetical protein